MSVFIKLLSFLSSFIALCLSVYAVSNQYYVNIPTTVLSLVGICATIIVGISVVDTFAVHPAFHKMEEKWANYQREWKNLQNRKRKSVK